MTIRTKLVAIVFIGLVVTMIIWGEVQISALENSIRNQRVQRLTELAETIRAHYQYFPQGNRISALDKTLSTLIQLDERLASVSIFEVEKTDVVDLVAGAGRIYYKWRDASIVEAAHKRKPHYADLKIEKGDAIGVLYPFRKDNTIIVISIISFSHFYDEIVAASKEFLLVSSFVFILIVTASLLFAYNLGVAKPLGVIIKTMDESISGKRVQRIPLRRGDEWGTLAQHFNEMADKIREVMAENEDINRELERKISKATHKILSLQNQINNLQRLSTLGYFVATLAHDLGTPLHSIAGMTELLLETPDLPAGQKRKLELILKQTRNLVSIIQNVRHATRPPEPHFAQTAMGELLEETLLFFEPMAKGQNIDVSIAIGDNLPLIYIDRNRVQTALFNILQNAREAIGENGKIEIKTWQDGSGFLVISVKDNGPGIPDDFQDKITTPFFSTRQGEGIRGLGLAIVGDVMKVHGGSLQIESNVGFGVEVRILFPI